MLKIFSNAITHFLRFMFVSTLGSISLSRLMSLIAFALNLFLQIFVVINGKDTYLELIITNYAFILSILGIKGYFETKSLIFNTRESLNQENNNTEGESKVQNKTFSRKIDI